MSTVANLAPGRIRSVLDAFDAGDTARAARLQRRAIDLVARTMSAGLPGTVTVKGLLNALGLLSGPVRAPLRPASPETVAALRASYEQLVTEPSL